MPRYTDRFSAKPLPVVGADVGLTQNAAESPNRNFGFLRNDGSVDNVLKPPHKLDVTAFWLVSTNPAASSRRLTSRKGCGLSRPNLNLDHANLWRTGGLRRLEVQLECFLQVVESFFFTLTLAGDIHFETLRDIPLSFAPDCCSERSLHDNILSQETCASPLARAK